MRHPGHIPGFPGPIGSDIRTPRGRHARRTDAHRARRRGGPPPRSARLRAGPGGPRGALRAAQRRDLARRRAACRVEAGRAGGRARREGVRRPGPGGREAQGARPRAQGRDPARRRRTSRRREAELREVMLAIPNLPDDETPDGDSDADAVEVRRWGTPPDFSFEPKDHVDLGEAMGILDFGRAAKLSGAAVQRRPRSRRACSSGPWRRSSSPCTPAATATPSSRCRTWSRRETMTGTGQLPKFEEDLFRTGTDDRSLYLIPTAEVPLTNLHAGEMLDADALPLAYTAWTPCFRSEAGSYGRDTRGILRLHQFSKVEMVRFCARGGVGRRAGADGLARRGVPAGARPGLPGDPARRGRHGVRRADDLRRRGLAAQPGHVPRDLVVLGLRHVPVAAGRASGRRTRRAAGRPSPPSTARGCRSGGRWPRCSSSTRSPTGRCRSRRCSHPYTGFRRILADGTTE